MIRNFLQPPPLPAGRASARGVACPSSDKLRQQGCPLRRYPVPGRINLAVSVILTVWHATCVGDGQLTR